MRREKRSSPWSPGGLVTSADCTLGDAESDPVFQSVIDQEVLRGLMRVICSVSVDGIVVKGRTPEELLQSFLTVLKRLFDSGLFAVAHQCNVYTRSVTWCGYVYSSEGITRFRSVSRWLVNTRRPARGGGGG